MSFPALHLQKNTGIFSFFSSAQVFVCEMHRGGEKKTHFSTLRFLGVGNPNQYFLPSLKVTFSHLNISHPKRKRSYSNHPFSGAMLVSGRVPTQKENRVGKQEGDSGFHKNSNKIHPPFTHFRERSHLNLPTFKKLPPSQSFRPSLRFQTIRMGPVKV